MNKLLIKEDPEAIRQVHQIQQDEARKEIENLGIINLKIHPAGGFDKENSFVYEPLGDKKYVFKFKSWKGVGIAVKEKVEDKKTGELKETKKWILKTEAENLKIYFKGKPLDKIIFNVPSDYAVNFWLNNFLVDGKKKEITQQHIFQILKNYFKAFFDLPMERNYDILVLGVFQSWLVEIVDVLFYLSISGETGSGKTALLEALMDLCRHGLLAANIKSAGIARCAERYKLSLGIDEIDAKKFRDDDVEGLCRQGYRRGQYYVRMMPKSHEPEFFDVYGFKAFSYRSAIADDLQNRSIDIPMNRTKDQQVPVINLFKQNFSPYELIFFWYLDNIANLYAQTPNFQLDMDKLEAKNYEKMTDKEKELFEVYMEGKKEYNNNDDNVNNVNTVNKVNVVNVNVNLLLNKVGIDRSIIARQTPYLVNFVNVINKHSIFGRNIEIAYLIYSMTQILNFDINEILLEAIEQKQEIEEASQEEGWIGLLRELLIQEFESAEIKDEVKIITYKSIISKYVRRMKEVYENVPSQYQIRKLLRQIGFVDSINRKVIRAGNSNRPHLCLVYDSKIKENLGIKEEQISLEKIK